MSVNDDASQSRIQNAAGLKRPIAHQLFIGGKFVPAADGATLATLNPHDNSPIVDIAIAIAGREDGGRAVAAAAAALPAWARSSASERGRLLLKLA